MTDFSVVDLRLEANGHVYGAALLHLLQALPIHTISKLRKVTLLRLEKSEVTLFFFAYMSHVGSTSPIQYRLLN